MKRRRITSLILSIALVITMFYGAVPVQAAEEQQTADSGQQTAGQGASSADLRLMYTTDIHGQVTNLNYQTSKTLSRGLNKVYTLIKQARSEAGSNYLTFDTGDCIMDYTTNYIYNQDSEALQPIYSALAAMDYDAITLGNHDFDFGYDYIVSQLEMSGMMDKVVLSNVTSAINGEYVFGSQNRIIDKKVTDKNGKEHIVRVGLFGVTPPSMSGKTENLKNFLTSEDILAAAEREVASLKKQGADIVIALAHSGFGTENPAKRAASVGYAMTKIDGLDVILGGHEHIYFPKENKNAVQYSLPGVDKETGLVNGKRLMVLQDSARALGVVDLHLSFDENGKVVLNGSDYEIRKTTASTITDPDITSIMDYWGSELSAYSSQQIGRLKDGVRWTNYEALMEQDKIMQVVQDAQIAYASNYIANSAPQYKGYPIVSVARYAKYGSESGEDYSDVTGDLRNGNLDSFSAYKKYINLYEITGKQLREWLEWSTVAYQTINTSKDSDWNDLVVDQYIKETGENSLITQSALVDWNRLFRIKGVEYTINPSEEPRYNYTGKFTNDTHRITSLTYNGVAVNDDQRFVVVTEQLLPSLQTDATAGIKDQLISKSYVLLQEIVKRYLADRYVLGDIDVEADQNWKLELPDNYKFIMVSGVNAESVLSKRDWYDGLYDTAGKFGYYKCTYHKKQDEKDTSVPNVVLASSNKEITNKPVTISVHANDISGIAEMKYYNGRADLNDPVWAASSAALVVTDGAIQADTNGAYSVYVKDGAGNATVEQIAVTNINPELLDKPTMKKVDNNDVIVYGTGAKGMKICIRSGSKIFTDTVDVDGEYEVGITPQKAKTKLYAYIEDSTGRKSSECMVTVKRAGPNCPKVTSLKNNSDILKGNTNDTNSMKVYAVIDNNVYVSKSLGKGYYVNCKKYDKKKKIILTDITMKKNGNFTISIPNQYSDTKVKVFTVDKLGRASRGRSSSVERVAPDRAAIYPICSGEKYVYGYIPNDTECRVTVKTADGKSHTGKSDGNGYYSVFTGRIKADDKIQVYAKDTSGSKNKSYISEKTVQTVSSLYKSKRDLKLKIDKVTDKSTVLSGDSTQPGTKIYLVSAYNSKKGETDNEGEYQIKLDSRQPVNSLVYVIIRAEKGYIKSMRCRRVVLGAPEQPKISGRLTAGQTRVAVRAKEKCTAMLKVNKKQYNRSSMSYDSKNKEYIYTFAVKRLYKYQKVKAILKNAAGRTVGNWITVKGKPKKK